MNAIHLKATVTEERRLIIDLPPDTPLGEVTVTVQPLYDEPTPEEFRRRLEAAGALTTIDEELPADFEPLSPEELLEWGRMPPGARPSEELIDEDRGEY